MRTYSGIQDLTREQWQLGMLTAFNSMRELYGSEPVLRAKMEEMCAKIAPVIDGEPVGVVYLALIACLEVVIEALPNPLEETKITSLVM